MKFISLFLNNLRFLSLVLFLFNLTVHIWLTGDEGLSVYSKLLQYYKSYLYFFLFFYFCHKVCLGNIFFNFELCNVCQPVIYFLRNIKLKTLRITQNLMLLVHNLYFFKTHLFFVREFAAHYVLSARDLSSPIMYILKIFQECTSLLFVIYFIYHLNLNYELIFSYIT